MVKPLFERTRSGVPFSRIIAVTVAASLLFLTLPAVVANAQDPTPDWRANLSCPAEQQVHEGLVYCMGKDAKGQLVHVLVADLSADDLRLEYILPKGASGRNDEIEECRDVNRPEWAGPAKGCYVPGNPGPSRR